MTIPPVIVGTDLSGAASEAIRQAAAWAARIGAPLVVAHVAPDELFRALETPRIVDALRERVDGLIQPFDVSVEVVIQAGSAHGAIVALADARGAALVVVGETGQGAVGRALFGGTTSQVVRYAHCPVLVARKSPATGPVLAATDFSADSQVAIAAAAREAQLRSAPLRVVHSQYEPTSTLSALGPMLISAPELPEAERSELHRAAEQTLQTLLQASGATGTAAVLAGPPAVTVPEEAERIGASLVVVSTRGRTGLARIALGSVAEAIARTSPCSVLAVRRDGTSAAE